MKVYALFSGKVLLPFAIQATRKEVIKYAEEYYIGESWEQIKKMGYSVKPCIIKPLEKTK